jgi:GNAT superfamily N-acetyltransferase
MSEPTRESVNELVFSPVPEDGQSRALDTLVSAFAQDPVERWLYPELPDYLTNFRPFLAAYGGAAFGAQTAWQLDDFAAVALWLPPGIEPNGDTVVSVLTETVAPAKHADLFAVMEQMDAAHPKYPHWYLPWFGVQAGRQGQALGGLLMRRCLEIVDQDHLPTYLESPNPRNLSFYERHGFEVVGHTQADACPPVAFMLRAAQ